MNMTGSKLDCLRQPERLHSASREAAIAQGIHFCSNKLVPQHTPRTMKEATFTSTCSKMSRLHVRPCVDK
jgi:hypothetical protein